MSQNISGALSNESENRNSQYAAHFFEYERLFVAVHSRCKHVSILLNRNLSKRVGDAIVGEMLGSHRLLITQSIIRLISFASNP
jgi:hypothetical protein